jgi:uncharacterized membrane protein YoaT (DUF817 family)
MDHLAHYKIHRYTFHDFWEFGVRQFRSAIFGITIIVALAITEFVHVPFIARYDLLLVIVILIQAVLLLTHFERPYDLIPIMVFHVIGVGLEIFKVQHGIWTYPDAGILKIAGVPLYSGFMYSAIGSYVVRAIKEFDIRVTNWPRWWWTVGLSGLIYLNYFTDTLSFDYRDFLYVAILIIFWKTKFTFVIRTRRHIWPAVLGYFLIGLFIYLAENIGSFFGAWRYSYQLSQWKLVDPGKISSWSLLIIVTVVIAIELQRLCAQRFHLTDITAAAEAVTVENESAPRKGPHPPES